MSNELSHIAPEVTPAPATAVPAPHSGPGRGQLRTAGVLMSLGAVVMAAGAVVHFATGADPWGELGVFLRDADGRSTAFAWNIGLWIAGLTALCAGVFVASDGVARDGDARSPGLLAFARYAAAAGGGAGLVFFPFMLALVTGFAGTEGLEPAARAVRDGATLADDVTTLLVMVGAAALVLGVGRAYVGRVVRGLTVASLAAASYAALELIGVVPEGPGLAVVPLGMLMVATAGVALARRGSTDGSRL